MKVRVTVKAVKEYDTEGWSNGMESFEQIAESIKLDTSFFDPLDHVTQCEDKDVTIEVEQVNAS